jgi:hypothetical protein
LRRPVDLRAGRLLHFASLAGKERACHQSSFRISG